MCEDRLQIKGPVLNQLDLIAKTTKADIFMLCPKPADIESASFNGNLESMDQRLRCAIYGDMETMEHAKTRVLIMIDQIVRPLSLVISTKTNVRLHSSSDTSTP
jgi:hypothetical protein